MNVGIINKMLLLILLKAERRCDQLEAEKIQAEEKCRQLEARFKTSDDRQHLLELEEELRMAKVNVTLYLFN